MNKILVPVDFSENSMNALDYAIRLFKDDPLEVVVLTTYEASTNAFYVKSIDRVLEEGAQDDMDRMIKKMTKEYPGVNFTSKIVKGNAVSVITSMGNSGEYDYIVMGTKGASGLKKVFIGSVAGGVIARTTAAVLVVPTGFTFQSFDKIVYAVGSTNYTDDTVLSPLRKMAEICKAKIDVLHVTDEEAPDLSRQLAPIEDLSPSVTYLTSEDNVSEGLKDYMSKQNAAMLCLVRTKKGFLGKIFNESVTLRQTFDSAVPLLVLHN
ncbi:MAG TPA: universal stress protein [Saprospiraceae bacterium]|nr:universal stress protein [Saprospiraceae bacterium]